MLFSGLPFLYYFLPAVLVCYFAAPRKLKNAVLFVFSLIFYGWGEPRYIVLMIVSIVSGFVFALMIEKKQNKKSGLILMWISVAVSLSFLLIFKYADFLIENVNQLPGVSLPLSKLSLPIGISFYTFQIISYTVDVWRGDTKAQRNIISFGTYVSLFPQLIAGPIVRYTDIERELQERKHSVTLAASGIKRFLIGLSKKVLIANVLGELTDICLKTSQPSILSWWMYAAALVLQIYFDFSGYSDMAIGLGRIFGFQFPENFNYPLISCSVKEFWRRWHITLGTWMKDYVFYPVTLSKWMGKFGKWGKKVFGKKTGRTLPICLANLIVFFVVGVWHGAAWKYIVYGMYNGIIIAFSGLMAEHYRNWKKKFNITGKENWYHVFMIIRTFILVNISWFFDRADTVGQAFHMMKLSVTKFAPSQLLLIPAGKEGTAFTPYALAILAAGCIILFIVSVLQERGMKIRESLAGLSLPITVAIYFCLLASIGFFGSTAVARGFIYAQF